MENIWIAYVQVDGSDAEILGRYNSLEQATIRVMSVVLRSLRDPEIYITAHAEDKGAYMLGDPQSDNAYKYVWLEEVELGDTPFGGRASLPLISRN